VGGVLVNLDEEKDDAVIAFGRELCSLRERFCLEWGISRAAAIGCLVTYAMDIWWEGIREDEEGDEGFAET
jgi:hypothetical protein